MKHPKMQYTYVGIDSHKATHTAVFLDCFFEKIGEITFENLPSKFPKFLKEAEKFKVDGTEFLFGLEDASSFGRTLATFLTDKACKVKHVNAHLVAKERKNQNITQKTDGIDAECTARVLLSKLNELPDAIPDEKFWILRTLVVGRDFIVKANTRSKMLLHSLLTQHYPNYRTFFVYLDGKTSLAFFKKYPSPSTLENVTKEELAEFLLIESGEIFGMEKAELILESLENTTVEHQEIRNEAVRSTIRQIEFYLNELEKIEVSMAVYLEKFDCTLTSMAGIDVVSACQILSCIGDVKRFPTAAKLARYAGIAPVTYASGQSEKQYANKRGNRELNSLFYALAVRLTSPVGPNNKILNMFFYDYYMRKLSEGKTKRQAMKCVERRLVNVVWTMLTNNEEYVNPPVFDKPKLDNGGKL
jgi:transposase